jgi:hypothetical protein
MWGPTCCSLDKFPDQYHHLPELHVGDWLKFPNMGAYSVSLTSDFNDMPRPQNYYVMADTHWQLVHKIAEDREHNDISYQLNTWEMERLSIQQHNECERLSLNKGST